MLTKPWPLRVSCWTRPAAAGSSTFLLLHGTGSDHGSFDRLVHRLPRETGLILPDLPGHGESAPNETPSFGLFEMAQWLEEALVQLQVSPNLLVGHSAGGAVALAMALTHPERSVLGLAPSLVPPPPLYNSLVGPWLGPIVRSRPSLAFGHWLAGQHLVIDRLLASTASPIDVNQQRRYRTLFASKAHLEGTLAFMAGTDLPALLADPRLSSIQKVAILSARDDPWIPAASLQEIVQTRLPTARTRWLDKGGHLFHESDSRPVLDFITELTRP